MCPPAFSKVSWEINPWMKIKNQPDANKIQLEYFLFLNILLQLGIEVFLMPQEPGLEDQIFTANAGWGRKNIFILANFKFQQRRKEKFFFKKWLQIHGFNVISLSSSFENKPLYFEGQGDFITSAPVYFFGHGFRSSFNALSKIKKFLEPGKKIFTFKLTNPCFYHLDTCLFSWKPENIIQYFPGAFSGEDRKKIESLRPKINLIEIDEKEALNFVCNSVYIENKAIMAGMSNRLIQVYRKLGYKVLSIESLKDFKIFQKKSFSKTIFNLPIPRELLKKGGGYRCATLFLD